MVRVTNGILMGCVTGTGCAATAVIGARGGGWDRLLATATALATGLPANMRQMARRGQAPLPCLHGRLMNTPEEMEHGAPHGRMSG